MSSVRQHKKAIRSELVGFGIEDSEAEVEAELMVEHVSGWNGAEQMMRADDDLPEPYRLLIAEIVAQRERRVPLQYCFGYGWFMGDKYLVRKGVFIPRTDTETVVQVVKTLSESLFAPEGRSPGGFTIGEVGTGSGAIAIALLKLLPALSVISCDINETALAVAKENARIHRVGNRLQLLHGDWKEILPKQLDAIVSNPPYIPLSQLVTMQPEVALHEPYAALFGGGDDGLDFYRELSLIGKHYLRDGRGLVVVEVGDGQADAVRAKFVDQRWANCDVHLDLNGLPRVISAAAL